MHASCLNFRCGSALHHSPLSVVALGLISGPNSVNGGHKGSKHVAACSWLTGAGYAAVKGTVTFGGSNGFTNPFTLQSCLRSCDANDCTATIIGSDCQAYTGAPTGTGDVTAPTTTYIYVPTTGGGYAALSGYTYSAAPPLSTTFPSAPTACTAACTAASCTFATFDSAGLGTCILYAVAPQALDTTRATVTSYFPVTVLS